MMRPATMRPVGIAMILVALCSFGVAAPRSAKADGADRARERSRGLAATDDDDETEHGEGAETDEAGEQAALEAGEAEGASSVRSAVPGPPIRAVLAAAYASTGLDRQPGRGWIRRARLAGLIPWVTVRAARDASWQDARSEISHGDTLEVRATWRLDRLLFDGRELQVASLEASRRRERQRLAARVIHCYFVWRRAMTGAGGAGARRTPRVAEAIAELDALTDGWFSDELLRLRQRSSRTRPPPAAAP
jgi:hypothetical protein